MLYDVSFNLTRLVPNTPLSRSQTAVRRGLEAIYDQIDWWFPEGLCRMAGSGDGV